MYARLIPLALLLTLVSALQGCGQKGALYIPQQPAPAATAPEDSAAREVDAAAGSEATEDNRD